MQLKYEKVECFKACGILGGEGCREVITIQAEKGLLADIEAAQAKEKAQ